MYCTNDDATALGWLDALGFGHAAHEQVTPWLAVDRGRNVGKLDALAGRDQPRRIRGVLSFFEHVSIMKGRVPIRQALATFRNMSSVARQNGGTRVSPQMRSN